jgi:hypothetical protein
MPQTYSGTLITNDGNKLGDVKIILKSKGEILAETTTDRNGKFNIVLATDAPPANTTITFSKNSFTLYTLKNVQPTSMFIDSFSDINPIFGGVLDLKGQFAGGKYLITSLPQSTQDRLFWETYNIAEFIKKNPDNYLIEIEASESTIPNYDREEFLENDDPNPKWAGPNKEPRAEGKLGLTVLSQKRFDSLRKYIENYLEVYSVKLDSKNPIQKTLKVGDNTENSQYVKLKVTLKSATCRDVDLNFGAARKNDITIPKPPGAKKVTLNALLLPDRFGINQEYTNYYSQAPSSQGSAISWGFMAYLTIYNDRDKFKNLNNKSYYDLPLQLIEKNKVKEALKTDLANPDISLYLRVTIVLFLKSRVRSEAEKSLFDKYLRDDRGLLNDNLINLLFENYVDANVQTYTRIAPVKQELTTFSLTDIGNQTLFTIQQIPGVLSDNSQFKVNICNN